MGRKPTTWIVQLHSRFGGYEWEAYTSFAAAMARAADVQACFSGYVPDVCVTVCGVRS